MPHKLSKTDVVAVKMHYKQGDLLIDSSDLGVSFMPFHLFRDAENELYFFISQVVCPIPMIPIVSNKILSLPISSNMFPSMTSSLSLSIKV